MVVTITRRKPISRGPLEQDIKKHTQKKEGRICLILIYRFGTYVCNFNHSLCFIGTQNRK